MPGRIDNSDTGDAACDHYHRYVEDIALMRELGVGAYQFSVAWPRRDQRGGSRLLRSTDRWMLAASIEPWLCLYHRDLPQVLQDEGGWLNRDIVAWFADYAQQIAN